MARKFLYLVAAVIVLVLLGLLALRLWPTELARIAFVPGKAFAAPAPLRTNAYEAPVMWHARPGDAGGINWLRPQGLPPAPPRGTAAIFYIHPTSYLNRAEWNAPLEDRESSVRARLITRMQASVFADAGEIWAPRYRQATFGSFLAASANAEASHQAAYRDVELAFAAFVKSVKPGQPIILAGHSQGSRHLLHLLRDHVKGKPIRKQIVAAYVVGWTVSIREDLPALDMAACKGPQDTGCILSWQSFAEPAETDTNEDAFDASNGLTGRPNRGATMLCSNMLAGGTSSPAPASVNSGTMKADEDALTNAKAKAELVKAAVPARCNDRGFLLIGDPPEMGNLLIPGNNYHVYDYSLFWADTRRDALTRLAAFEARR